ncbi:response regulator [Pseudoalteromonas luteoviolacea]|uniref:response regulator n=1 Tax=Pseudoalteromonas luteoviolacea TaxID=43657 RepID=UPI00115216CA|nr:response regulator [Pseudoalteromonas luteoviolacea]TQF72534.1 response regulator [Pseudoalteromonas luteoviolacea]
MQKILLIDDDRELTTLISQFLEQNGFMVDVLNDGRRAAEYVFKVQPDLIILDLMLPGTDGLTICREIRPHFSGAIIMLTALVDDIDEVTGLEVGADDYLCKPLKPRVLLAHIRAQLRRQSSLQEQHKDIRTVCDGSLQLDWRNRTVSYLNTEVTLSSAEFELLWVLAQSAGSIISRDSLHRKIFNLEYDAMDRSIDLRISRLRKKLGDDPKQPQVIKTIRNKGYLIAD